MDDDHFIKDVSEFLKNIRNIQTKSVILKKLYFINVSNSKLQLKYDSGTYSIVTI